MWIGDWLLAIKLFGAPGDAIGEVCGGGGVMRGGGNCIAWFRLGIAHSPRRRMIFLPRVFIFAGKCFLQRYTHSLTARLPFQINLNCAVVTCLKDCDGN